MIFYHRTTAARAKAILEGGFGDGEGTYMTDTLYRGVWLSDRPLDGNEGAFGDELLVVDLPLPESELSFWEWVEEGRSYREWLLPAALVNEAGTVKTCSDEEVAA